jgi:Glycosyltransferase family 87
MHGGFTTRARTTIDARMPDHRRLRPRPSIGTRLPRILRRVTIPSGATAHRREVGLGVVLGGVGAGLLLIAGLAMLGGAGTAYDLAAYLAAAGRVLAGGTPYQPETLGGPFRPGPSGLYLYAPPLAVAMTLLAQLPAATSTVLWLVLRIAALTAACAVLPVRPWIRGATLLVAAFSYPVLFDLNLGNVSIAVLALAAVGWRWLDQPAGAIAIGFALLVRPTLAVVPAWQALRRRWRPIVWTGIAVIVVGLVTLPVVGLGGYIDYLTVLRNVSDVFGVPRNVDLGSAAATLGLPAPWPAVAYLTGVAIAIAVIVLAARRDASAGYVATVGASLLLAPLLWAHYLVGLLLPAALLADRGRRWGLLLPLLGWLPEPLLPFVALVGALVPLLVSRPESGSVGSLEAEPVPDDRP